MPLPGSKQELADWILRRLGAPVVNVEIADVQLEDVIDEAVQFFQEFHYDGAERTYRTIKIEGDVLNGNNRMHQGANAPMYDATYTKYRLGDRTMTYKSNGMPDKIWVRYDSEEYIVFRYYNSDSESGGLFVYDSDLLFRDDMAIFDSEARDHTDSDGVYVPYDSDKHNAFVYDPIATSGFYYSVVTSKPDSDNYVKDSDGTFVSYDSDNHVVYQYDSDNAGLWVDSDGTFVSYDSDKHVTHGYEIVVDSDLVDVFYVDSDSEFVRYDSDKHGVITTYVSDPSGLYVREEGLDRFVLASIDPKYAASPKFSPLYNRPTLYSQTDVQPQRFSRQFGYPTVYRLVPRESFVDSDGTYVRYDSDKHYVWQVDSEGTHTIDSDGNYQVYDSDRDKVFQYDSESEGLWIDSEGVFVLYDSEKHTYVKYESDNAGLLIDSDGTFVTFDSTKYSVYSYDSESIKLDSDGNVSGRVPDSEGDLQGLYVRFILDKDSEEYVLYDSDQHIGIFYDSDGLGGKGTFGINIDRLFRRTTTVVSPQRFSADRVPLSQRFIRQHRTKTRYNKVHNFAKFYRRTEPLGQRFSFSDLKQVRRTDYAFTDFWKEENLVLTEPVVDYDYSKVGQVGIPIPDTILGINKIFRIDNFSGMGMWNYEYQYFMNNFDFFYGNGGSSSMAMTNYYTTKSYLDLIDNMMNVQPAIRFNKHRNRLYIDTNWARLKRSVGRRDYYLMMECYEVNDPEVFGDVYKDKWLKRYATALAKMQWGSNMKKYTNTELPGGLMVDGQSLYDEAKAEADALEEELRNTQLEMDFLIG